MQVPEANLLPIRSYESGDFVGHSIYSIAGQPGMYRRVSRNGRAGLKTDNGHALAIISTGGTYSLCELKRWREGEELLRPLLPGVESPNPDQEEMPL